MRSIRTKLIFLVAAALISTALLIGSFCLVASVDAMHEDTEVIITSACSNSARVIDLFMNDILLSTRLVHSYASETIRTPDIIQDDNTRAALLANIDNFATHIANVTNYSLGFFCRLNDQLAGPKQGFLYIRSSLDEAFLSTPLPSVLHPDDPASSWFTTISNANGPLWLPPASNLFDEGHVISYEMPWYAPDGTFLGVVGFEMDFEYLLERAAETNTYPAAIFSLADTAQGKYYTFVEDHQLFSDTLPTAFASQIMETKPGTIVTTQNNAVVYTTCWYPLDNGMFLILAAPLSETEAAANRLIILTIGICFTMLAVFLFVTTVITRRIVTPLQALTNAARRMAEGHDDIVFTCTTHDEVADLTQSFHSMASRIRQMLEDANNRADRDGLTGVKNKGYYLEYVIALQQRCNSENVAYAVIVLDINYLKHVNDTYGHNAGDELIRISSTLICRVFAHSPVFRIGGDEFCVILQGGDYNLRDTLLLRLEHEMVEMQNVPGGELSIACGMADHPASSNTTYDELFRQADARMYEHKRRCKESRR